MKRKWVIVCCLLYTLAASFYRTYGPKGTDYVLPPLPPAENWLLLPLDGRPPCKDFTVQLGALGGTTLRCRRLTLLWITMKSPPISQL